MPSEGLAAIVDQRGKLFENASDRLFLLTRSVLHEAFPIKACGKPGVNVQNDHCGPDREKQFKDSTTLSDFWIAVVKSQLACRCAA
jgi:hypothetical protein